MSWEKHLGALAQLDALAEEPERSIRALDALMERAHAEWPAWLDRFALAEYLAPILSKAELEAGSPLSALGTMRPEIYLCAAVLAEDKVAIRVLEGRLRQVAVPTCRRLGADAASTMETLSAVLEKLLVKAGGRRSHCRLRRPRRPRRMLQRTGRFAGCAPQGS